MSARLRLAPDPREAYVRRLREALALLEEPMPVVGRFPVVTGTSRRNRHQHAVAQAREALRRALELAG